MRRVLLFVAVAVCFAPAGCGEDSGTSDAEQVRKVGDAFNDALFAGRGAEACSYATPAYQRQLIRNSRAAGVRGRTCAELVSNGVALVKQYGVEPPEVDEVAADGNKATVRETQAGRHEDGGLLREDRRPLEGGREQELEIAAA